MVETSPYGKILRKKKGESLQSLANRQQAEFKRGIKEYKKKKKKSRR